MEETGGSVVLSETNQLKMLKRLSASHLTNERTVKSSGEAGAGLGGDCSDSN